MKRNIIAIIIILILVLIVVAGYFFIQYKPVDQTLEGYLNSKRAYYIEELNLSEDSLNKILDQIFLLEEELKVQLENYRDLIQVGVLYQRLHEYDLAKEKFEKAIEVLPGEGTAYGNLAELYVFNFKDFDKAVENYKKAITNDHWRVDYYRSLADLYQSEFPEKKTEIESMFLDGVEKNPNKKKDFYSYLVDFFWLEGQFDKAIDYTKKLIEIEPNNQQWQQILKDLQAELNK